MAERPGAAAFWVVVEVEPSASEEPGQGRAAS